MDSYAGMDPTTSRVLQVLDLPRLMLKEDDYASDSDRDLTLNGSAITYDGSRADPEDDDTTLNPDDNELDLPNPLQSKPPTPTPPPIVGKKHKQGKLAHILCLNSHDHFVHTRTS